MKIKVKRFAIGLLFSIPFGLIPFAWVQANPTMDVVSSEELDCQSCHPAFVATWGNSSHSSAKSSTNFLESLKDVEDNRECFDCHTTGYDPITNTWHDYGITCEACHSPLTENHPLEPMTSDRDSELCGECHIETENAWNTSMHKDTGLSCIDCHGQHSTNLKAEDATALCENCHVETASDFIHTSHSIEEASCADCHLELTSTSPDEQHAARDHSFFVKFGTCKECHESRENAVEITSVTEDHPDAMAAVASLGVSMEPNAVSPIYFSMLAALIGMASGLVLAPWIERWFKKINADIKVEK